jgi:hypothetical protein
MKHTLYSIMAAFLVLGSFSCKKKADLAAAIEPVNTSKSYLKVIHSSPSFRLIHNQPDTFNVFVNNQKINATTLSYDGIFPFSVNSTTNSFTATYAAVEPGASNIRLALPGKANPDSLTIFSLDKTLEGGKFYTLMITDSIKMERDSSKIFVQDLFNQLPVRSGYFNFRFINAAMNDTAGKTVNVFSYARNASIFTNVKPGTITGFSQLGFNITVPDTFYIRRFLGTGVKDTGQIFAKIFFNSAVAGGGNPDQRSYTLYYKGNANIATGAKARSVAAYIND